MRFGERLRQERRRRHLSQEALAEALGTSVKSISRWEQNRAIPQGYARLQLSRFFRLSPEDLFADFEVQMPPADIWTVPFPRNLYFTGREEILQTLHTRLSASRPIVLTQSFALSGLGGIGKTQVAIEYAYRYAQEYKAVFWLAAETMETLVRSLQVLANHLQLPERERREQEQMVQGVQRWLSTHPGWLLIGDNVEDLEVLQRVLPMRRPGTLLLTTRQQALGTLAEPLLLPAMSVQEGTTLLLRRAKQLGDAPAQRDTAAEALPETSVSSATTDLVSMLEGLPLAVDQAGAYIEETGCSVQDYLQRYHHQRHYLLARRGLHGGAHPESVATTLALSVEYVEREHPAAGALLRACSFLHPDTIPEDLLVAGASHLGTVLGPVVADPYQLDLALAALRSASLVTRQPDTRSFSVHRLVQAVLQDQMEPTEMRLWSERLVCMINAAFPDPEDLDVWHLCERYLMHTLACVPLVELLERNLVEANELFFKAGSYLAERGNLREAQDLLERALILGEQQYGLDHQLLIPRLDKLARVLHRQGQYKSSEPIWHRLLALVEHHLGPVHPQMARTLNGLAALYESQGKYAQAESYYQRCLSILEQTEDHPFLMAEALNDLALLYWHQGKYEQAEPLYQHSLHIMREQQPGKEHPQIADVLNSLALLYHDQGKYKQAEPLYQQSLRIREVIRGPLHPQIANSCNNLASLYQAQGKYEQAEPLYIRALEILEQQEGPENPHVASPLTNLANLYRDQGKYEQAEPLYERALCIREQQLGPQHPMTARSLAGLATLYREQGKCEQAELFYKRALHIREQQLGSEHPETAATRSDLATLYRDQGQYEQAEPLYLQSLHLREQHPGSQYPWTAKTLTEFATLYRLQGKDEQAEPLYQQALLTCEQQFGPEHPQTAETLQQFAHFREAQGNTREAVLLYRRALASGKAVLGPQHPKTTAISERLHKLMDFTN